MSRVPVESIPVAKYMPTVGRMVLIKSIHRAAADHLLPSAIDTNPAVVTDVFLPPAGSSLSSSSADTSGGHPMIHCVPFGAGNVNDVNGAGQPLLGLLLFDPLPPGQVPDLAPRVRGQIPGRLVWAEWMPFQEKKHAEEIASGGHTTPPR